MKLNAEQLAHYQREGYVIVPNVFSKESMQKALESLDLRTYGRPFAEHLAEYDRLGEIPAKPVNDKAPPNRSFPCGYPDVDSLFNNDTFLDIIEDCLGDAAHFLNGGPFVRNGLSDTLPDKQGWHIDNWSFTFLPVSADVDRYSYVNAWVYLHDIEPDGAPVNVVPGSHRQVADLTPRLLAAGSWEGRNEFKDIAEATEFAAPVAATGTAGSVLIYNSYLAHKAVNFKDKRRQRSVWHISLSRREGQGWSHFAETWTWTAREAFIQFWCTTSPRVRSIFGWPPPGHPYYTPQTLATLAVWYPGMDLGPYTSPTV